MNGKAQAIQEIKEFLVSDEKCMLITGTHQYKKHLLVMSILDKEYSKRRILFRINGMENINDRNFTPLKKKPIAGEAVRLGNNAYEFDSFNTVNTWHKTSKKFSFAILYPIDALCRSKKLDALEDLFKHKEINKIFLCSWTDAIDYDYSIFSSYFTRHVVYDAQEDDPAYHQRVLDITKGRR